MGNLIQGVGIGAGGKANLRRYVLIDYMHLAHKCINLPQLSATMHIMGEIKEINTTIPTYTIKNILGFSGKGLHFTGVFFDVPGGSEVRKKHFAVLQEDGYKGKRQSRNTPFYKGVELTTNLLCNALVSCYRVEGYEADDLIYSVVQKIKEIDKETPIDIITNDGDLLPLVDEQVSVYKRGTRQYAEEGCPERRLYFQVTPNTWDDYMSYSSEYKAYNIPYNAILLYKMIKGDKSDNIPIIVKGYGGKKFTELINNMREDGVEFDKVFRYGLDFDEVIRPVLTKYFEESDINNMKYVYDGINLRCINSIKIPKLINTGKLQSTLLPLKINLRV